MPEQPFSDLPHTDLPHAGLSAEAGRTDLDERKAAILRAIVEQYVATAQPVGSANVARFAELGVSAATVRNEMSVLEREGYIAQPHTSAGRVPTDHGYRYYVDHLAGTTTLPAPERRRIAEFFTSATMAMDELLHQTSQLLVRVTAHAAVVVGPQSEAVVIRGAHLALLQPRALLAVVILSNGAVEKEPVFLEQDVTDEDVAAASARLARLLDGRRMGDLPLPVLEQGAHDDADQLVRAACEALRTHLDTHQSEALYVGGASRLAADAEAFSGTTVARLIDLLEQHVVLAALLREMLGPGLTVRIGSENQRADLHECAIVLAPYIVEGTPAGTVGVLGPTRMDYRKAQAAVATVSQQLGRQLSR
jgi:heat-inducible transcriptional repressor